MRDPVVGTLRQAGLGVHMGRRHVPEQIRGPWQPEGSARRRRLDRLILLYKLAHILVPRRQIRARQTVSEGQPHEQSVVGLTVRVVDPVDEWT